MQSFRSVAPLLAEFLILKDFANIQTVLSLLPKNHLIASIILIWQDILLRIYEGIYVGPLYSQEKFHPNRPSIGPTAGFKSKDFQKGHKWGFLDN